MRAAAALATEPPGLRSVVQEAVGSLSRAYQGLPQGSAAAQELDGLLAEAITSKHVRVGKRRPKGANGLRGGCVLGVWGSGVAGVWARLGAYAGQDLPLLCSHQDAYTTLARLFLKEWWHEYHGAVI